MEWEYCLKLYLQFEQYQEYLRIEEIKDQNKIILNKSQKDTNKEKEIIEKPFIDIGILVIFSLGYLLLKND